MRWRVGLLNIAIYIAVGEEFRAYISWTFFLVDEVCGERNIKTILKFILH
jgi:hypothetical protein